MNVEPDNVKGYLDGVISACEREEAELVLMTVPPNSTGDVGGFKGRRMEVNGYITSCVCGEGGYTICDVSGEIPFEEKGMYDPDGVHWTKKGYRRVGELLVGAIEGVLKKG